MRRLLFIFVCLGYLFSAVQAQDIITLTNGKDIRSKVTEITSMEVKYKVFDNLSGPDFGLFYADIFMIKYENGDRDMFEKNPTTGKIQIRNIVNKNPKKTPGTVTNSTPGINITPTQPQISDSAAAQINPAPPVITPQQYPTTFPEFPTEFLPVPATGETLYFGDAHFLTVNYFKVAFILSADKRTVKNLKIVYKDFASKDELKQMSFTAPNVFQVNQSTDIVYNNTMTNTRIIGLTFQTDGAKARINHRYMGVAGSNTGIDFGSSEIFFRVLNDERPEIPQHAGGEIKPMNNGTFEMISTDAESVQFKVSKETSLYKVAFVAGDNKTINAVSISNIEGDMHLGNGATAKEGSFLMLTNKIELPANTVVKCGFKDIPPNFKPERIMFLTDEKAVAMYFDLPSGEWAKIYLPPATPKTEPEFDARTGEYDIVELIEQKIIEVEINGRDITNVNVRIRKRVSYPVNLRIPVGSYFVSANPSAQNMVATGAKNARLTGDGWQNVTVPAACANRPKDIPDSDDKFTVIRSPNQAELVVLMPALNKAGAETGTKQAAVWIVTDNANYSELGILISSPGNVRAIGANETARAMKICSDAGIDITKKRIWNDKQTILNKLPAGALKTWLNGK